MQNDKQPIVIEAALLDGKLVDVLIDSGIIQRVVQHGAEQFDFDYKPLDGNGLSVFPGLRNMHSHAPMTLMRGLGDDKPLDVWLNEYIWPAEQHLTDKMIYDGTLQACKEMLASGTTFFNDMYFHLPAMARAILDSGIKARIGLNIFKYGVELDGIEDILKECEGVELSIAPHSIYTVNEVGLRKSADACQLYGLPMHIHMSETLNEVENCLKEHGCRPWEWLDRLGILDKLGDRIIAAHCLHLSDNEIKLIGGHHITCVHCPNSNLKLGSGYKFPMLELLDAGANVTLGTDGSASSNNLDMIEVMKTAALLQKGWRMDPTAVPAEMILEIATCGHKISAGEPADMFLAPVRSISELVYATHGESVAITIVDGLLHLKQ